MKANSIITILLVLVTVFTVDAQTKRSITSTKRDHIASKSGLDQSAFYPAVMGDRFIIDASKDGKERQFPFVYKFDKNIFISYSEHPDVAIAAPKDAMFISRDNGSTWERKITNKNFYLTSMFKKDGVLYGIVYFTYPKSRQQEEMIYWTSSDNGRTWTEHQGIVNSPKNKRFVKNGHRGKGILGSMLFHRGMVVMEDGSIQGMMYGHMAGDKKYRVVWVKSTDNCKTWKIVSTIAFGIPEGKEYKKAEGYCEPTFARVKDGSILCVMRIGSYLPLFQSRSNDNGLTWTRPVILPGLPDSVAESVDPHLLLMDNGVLALSYGRTGDKMVFSTDGSGHEWGHPLDTYTGVTTGYTGIVEVKPDTLLLIADQGANWSREAGQKAIWGRFIYTKFGKGLKN